MTNKTGKEIARRALRGAIETRIRGSSALSDPICIYDLSERLGVEVRFCRGSSFGGMYNKDSQTVLVPSLRPHGRQAFTCAHELGHWYFEHGSKIDEFEAMDKDFVSEIEERLANMYAGYLLMPPWAVVDAFSRRQWTPSHCTPFQVYAIANQLNVGYESLIQHLRWSLKLISETHAKTLLNTNPKQLKKSLLGEINVRRLVLVDCAWTKVPIDLQIDDVAILPEHSTVEGASVCAAGNHELGVIVEARIPGISRAESDDGTWATYIRVCRKDFSGRSIYRHLEDPDVNHATGSNQ